MVSDRPRGESSCLDSSPGLRFALLWAIFDASLGMRQASTRMDCKKRPVRQQEAVVQLPVPGGLHIAFETRCYAGVNPQSSPGARMKAIGR